MATETTAVMDTRLSETQNAEMQSDTSFKTNTARLLDMMIGWAEYVEATEDEFPDTLKSAELYSLYQDAAQLMLIDGLADKRAAVAAFLSERVMPLVLRDS